MSIDVEVTDGIATITINRPERMNAMDAEHYKGLSQAWMRVRDDAAIRVEAFDPVDEQQRVAVRKRCHDPPDVQRAKLLRVRPFAHRPCGCCCCCWGIGVTLTEGRAWFSAARTSLVTSMLLSLASVAPLAIAMAAPRRARVCSTIWTSFAPICC